MKLSYCGQLIKEYDPDRFFISLMMPEEFYEDLWAVLAFNHEIAKTREVVSETQLGLIRLQWWREEIEKLYDTGRPSGHEVLKPLAEAIERCALSHKYFEDLIYAREFDLEDVLPTRLEGTINYADFTNTPLLKLILEVMGDKPGLEAVQPVAVNYGLMGLLRAAPFMAAQKRCYLPEELLHQYNVRRLYELKPEGDLKTVVKAISEEFVPGLRPQNKFLAKLDKLSGIYLKQLKSCDYNVFHPRMRLQPPFKTLRLWFS